MQILHPYGLHRVEVDIEDLAGASRMEIVDRKLEEKVVNTVIKTRLQYLFHLQNPTKYF